MEFLRCRFSVIVLLSIWFLIYVEKAHADDKDSFYHNFLLQRIRIAKIRDFRGDATAKTLLKSLLKEANDTGLKIPSWFRLKPSEEKFNYNFRLSDKDGSREYNTLIQSASKIYSLPPSLIKAVIKAESNFINGTISKKGAEGLMQLMPETANEIGVENPFDPHANILGGSKLLRKYLNEFGSLKKALIAYNAGPGWVRKRKGIPKETRIYIRKVIKYYNIYKE